VSVPYYPLFDPQKQCNVKEMKRLTYIGSARAGAPGWNCTVEVVDWADCQIDGEDVSCRESIVLLVVSYG
jgi:hypothetical protein